MTPSNVALRAAIHTALRSDGALAAVLGESRVYDEPPRNAAFPYVTLGEARLMDSSGDGGETQEHQLTLHAWSRQGGHREAHMIAGALLQALDDAPLSLEENRLVNLRFALADIRRENDGKTYHALVRFRAVTEPALGPVQALALDLPMLDSSDPSVLTRLAVFASPWPGSVTVWCSADGLSFERAATALAPSVIGETLDALSAGPTGCWDRGGEMRVQLYGGALASLADANVLNGANAAAVMNTDGVWEVIQFAQADLVDEKTYRLSRLLRGQAGSEYAIAAPLPAGAPFVLLDEHLIEIARGIGALDRATDLRIVATGRSHDDPSALAMTLTPQPTALMPLSPVHLHAARDSGGDVAVSWIRRTRKDGDAWGVEVPLGEDSEAYEIEILSGSTVKRTLSVNTPAGTYSSADEAVDFDGMQTSLTIRVFQLSSTVGRGHPAQSTFAL